MSGKMIAPIQEKHWQLVSERQLVTSRPCGILALGNANKTSEILRSYLALDPGVNRAAHF